MPTLTRRFLFFFVVFFICPFPLGCEKERSPVTVWSQDLARFYHDDPSTAQNTFAGRHLLLALSNPVVRGNEVHWHISSPEFPAVIICRFAEPVALVRVDLVWIEGFCEGITRDGVKREFVGMNFHIIVTGCRIAVPPNVQRP